MFRKNTRHQQIPLTSHVDELPEKLRKRLENSWGGVFYREIVTTQAEMRRKAKIGVKNGNADKADTE